MGVEVAFSSFVEEESTFEEVMDYTSQFSFVEEESTFEEEPKDWISNSSQIGNVPSFPGLLLRRIFRMRNMMSGKELMRYVSRKKSPVTTEVRQ